MCKISKKELPLTDTQQSLTHACLLPLKVAFEVSLRLQGADLYQSVRVSSVFPPHHRVLAEGQHFVVQLLGRVQLCDPVDCSIPGSSVLHYLLEFSQIHLH